MAQTLKESVTADRTPTARVLTVVLHCDDALSPPTAAWLWDAAKLALGRGEEDALSGGKLTVKDPRASTAHAELLVEGDEAVVRDLGSSNGTWVNGVRVQRQTTLQSGDLIELGRTVVCYREAPLPDAKRVVGKGGQAGATFGTLRTLNPELGEIYARLAKVAHTAQPMLIVGETGTGKDVLANELHRVSARPGPFIAVDCGAVPDNLFESTLFGHEKGAFTGATEQRTGELARAQKGTLLLDEVGNLTPTAQAKLLRVLETSKVTPLGGTKTVDLDVRWLAATNRFLTREGDDFRSDLLHRLAGFVVHLPPLRHRREDLGLLIAHFLKAAGVKKASVAPLAARALLNHALGGNIRQLRNVLQRASHAGAEVVVDAEALGVLEKPALRRAPAVSGTDADADADSESEPGKFPRGYLPEKAELESALVNAKGNVAEAARKLGTSSRQLYRWLARSDIDPESFRPT